MGQFDYMYNSLINKVIENGVFQSSESVRSKWKDGTPAPAVALFGEVLRIPNDIVPVSTTKELKDLNALLELEWIWVKKSNRVQDLRDAGCGIWNNWEIKDPSSKWDGTIGPAYGYVLGKEVRKFPVDKLHREHLDPSKEYTVFNGHVMLDSVDYLIQTLLTNKESRRLVTSLWDLKSLDEMSLEPCVWNTNWVTIGNTLNLKVGIRSNDLALGNPFNVYQYFVLHNMICQVVGLERGEIKFDIDNAHIYDRHIASLSVQMNETILGEPEFWMNPDVTNFYSFDMRKDFKLTIPSPDGQKPKNIKFEISI